MENRRILYYGTRSSKANEILLKKICEAVETIKNVQAKNPEGKSYENFVIVTFHQTEFIKTEISKFREVKGFKIIEHKFEINPFTTKSDENFIHCHFFLKLDLLLESLKDEKNKGLSEISLFIDDTFTSKLEEFLEDLSVTQLNIKSLIVTMDPIMNILLQQSWNKMNFNYYKKRFNLESKNLDNIESTSLSEYIDDWLLKSMNNFSRFDCEIIKMNCDESNLVNEIESITDELKENIDDIKVYIHDDVISKQHDHIMLKLMKSELKHEKLNYINFETLESNNYPHVILCMPLKFENNRDLFKHIYYFIVKETKRLTIVFAKRDENNENEENVFRKVQKDVNEVLNHNHNYKDVKKFLEKFFFLNEFNEDETVVNFFGLKLADELNERLCGTSVDDIHNKLIELKNENKQELIEFFYKRNLNEPTEYEIKAFQLIKYKRTEEFIELIENNDKIRIEARNIEGSMLHVAIKYERRDIMKYLISKNANKNTIDSYGRDIMKTATLCTKGNDEIMNYLTGNGFLAFNNNKSLEIILTNNFSNCIDLKFVDEFGATPLHYIAGTGRIDVLRQLNLNNAKFDLKDKAGFTCFDRAASNGNLETLIFLLDSAGIEYKGSHKIITSVLECSVCSCSLNIIKWWFENVKEIPENVINQNLVNIGYFAEDETAIKSTFDYFCSFEKEGIKPIKFEDNLIMKFIKKYYCPISLNLVEYLIQKGVDIKKKNSSEQTIVHIATQEGHIELLKYLLNKGFSLTDSDKDGNTPLIIASEKGLIEVVEFLLEQNLPIENLSQKNKEGFNALDKALIKGYNFIADILRKQLLVSNIPEFDSKNFSSKNHYEKILLYPQILLTKCIAKYKKPRIDTIYLVRGTDRGKEAWHYVDVYPCLMEKFLRLTKDGTGAIDVAYYGEVLHSGWGKDPPDEIVKKIEEISNDAIEKTNQIYYDLIKLGKIEIIEKVKLKTYKDNYDASLLHILAAYGRNDVIIHLFLDGFDLETTDKYGNTALYYAAVNNKKETIILLKLLGLNVMYIGECKFLSGHYQHYGKFESSFYSKPLIRQLLNAIEVFEEQAVPKSYQESIKEHFEEHFPTEKQKYTCSLM